MPPTAHRAIGEALREPFRVLACASCSRANRSWASSSAARPRACTPYGMAPSNAGCCASHPASARCGAKPRGVVIDDADTRAVGWRADVRQPRCARTCSTWARSRERANVGCWRLYDADMPEYALAVDLYTGAGPDEGRRWLYVQEYAPPATVDPDAARRRREEALSVLPEVTGMPLADIRLRTRRRQKDGGSTRSSTAARNSMSWRRRTEGAGEPRRLPRHRPVPRSSADAAANWRAVSGQALPEPLLLHRRGHRACRGGRARRHRSASTCRAPTWTGPRTTWN